MTEWKTAQQAVEIHKISFSELISLMKSGLQAYDETGRFRIFDNDSWKFVRRESHDAIIEEEVRNYKAILDSYDVIAGNYENEKKCKGRYFFKIKLVAIEKRYCFKFLSERGDIRIKTFDKWIAQPRNIPVNPPVNAVFYSFTIPINEEKKRIWVKKVKKFLFKSDEVSSYIQKMKEDKGLKREGSVPYSVILIWEDAARGETKGRRKQLLAALRVAEGRTSKDIGQELGISGVANVARYKREGFELGQDLNLPDLSEYIPKHRIQPRTTPPCTK